jgi:hypothetical protein
VIGGVAFDVRHATAGLDIATLLVQQPIQVQQIP